MILRGGTTYVAATLGTGSHASLYALHRSRRVEVLPDRVTFPPGFNFETALQRGRGQFGIAADGLAQIKIVLLCENALADLLEESPLSGDQQSKRIDETRVQVRATVADSWELRCWLLGRGSALVVQGPVSLRREISEALRNAARAYENV